MIGTYLLIALVAICFALWPAESANVLTSVSLKIQVYWLNYRMKFMAWRMHRKLSRDMKKRFNSEIPPFKWVDLWDRN